MSKFYSPYGEFEADQRIVVRNPEKLGELVVWCDKNDYKVNHINQNTPGIPDFDGDPQLDPWWEVYITDESPRAKQIREAIKQFLPEESRKGEQQ